MNALSAANHGMSFIDKYSESGLIHRLNYTDNAQTPAGPAATL